MFISDLYVLNYLGIGIILGVDGLKKYKAIINLETTIISLEIAEGKRMSVLCEATKERKSGYLSNLNIEKTDPTLEEMPVVNQYKDVFE